jgi:hypothetical protein
MLPQEELPWELKVMICGLLFSMPNKLVFDIICMVDKCFKQQAYLLRDEFKLMPFELTTTDFNYKISSFFVKPYMYFDVGDSVCGHYLKIGGFPDRYDITPIHFITRNTFICLAYYDCARTSYHSFTGKVLGCFKETLELYPVKILLIEKSQPILITTEDDVALSGKETVAIDALHHSSHCTYHGVVWIDDDGTIKMTFMDERCSTPHALSCECVVSYDGTIRLHLKNRQ